MQPSATDRSLRVGLAGVGRFGQLHAGVLADLPGVELAALADPDPIGLARVADRHGVTARYRDALELIADDSLDAVVLATPDEQHAPRPVRPWPGAAICSWRNPWPPPGRKPESCSSWRPKPA
jgi:hypothetical protein